QSLFDSPSLSDASLLEWSNAANALNSSTTDNTLNDDLLSLSLLASLTPNSSDPLSVQSAHLAHLQMAALAAATRYNSALAGVQSAQSRRTSSASFSPSLHSPLTAPSTPIHTQKAVSPSSPTGNAFNHPPKNPKLYKTELCRSWMDIGRCNYGERCQYAHGEHEKRPIPRHPKYKTEACQSYHQSGYCPYGPRCHFIHNENEMMAAQIQSQTAAAGGKQQMLKMDSSSLNPLLNSQLSPLLSAAISNTV
ncbi:hypothetical protein PMAYCL1PPCAC_29153, partial [Pristionchus mayeri]